MSISESEDSKFLLEVIWGMLYSNNMSEEKMLEKFAEMLLANNERLVISIRKDIETSENRLREELTEKIEGSENRLREEFKLELDDAVDVLSELMHSGYNLHEARIQRVEKELHLPPLKSN